ncbi:hypothetical protein [Candidatus Venteria ishoeyi]|uniref:CRISPR-associated protein n=1 Tax=Candidatus Venteria ishoeyi TaxID=1899563 RepID=A0A1H6FFG9_9GAMM|nr:hypothetical protein [Candidatus Venteria ishoeyi]SEH08161.1 Uncharacterised protein [Candidatus Venteria ishoeyi]
MECLKKGSFCIILKPDRPFCFARPHSGDSNRFESEDFIPGAAIRAALARNMKTGGKLEQYFHKLYIRHAFASPENNIGQIRPFVIPLSFVVDHNDEFRDACLQSKPGLLNGDAPTFLPDWKDKHYPQVFEFLQQQPPKQEQEKLERQVVVHTAIDSHSGRSLEKGLFTLETIEPDNYCWHSEVHFDDHDINESDKIEVLNELDSLFQQGLSALGKTNACATVSYAATTLTAKTFCEQWEVISETPDNTLVLILQTPALLLPDLEGLHSSNSDATLLEKYRQSWKVLSQDSLELSHFYAQQHLAGGSYMQKRFWADKDDYYPEILTNAGSVFVFHLKQDKLEIAQTQLKKWLKTGLPQHGDQHLGQHWETNPYIAANGYGEIRIRPKQWVEKQVKPGEWDDC